MGLGKILIRLAASVALLFGLMWAIPQLAPEVPEPYKGVQALPPVSPDPTGSATAPPPLPPGFPSMNRPPPKIEVPDGQPQPIATKFGWTYEIPADWRNFSTGIAGWSNDGKSVVYGASADYGYGYCPEVDGASLAESGMTGRNGMDLHAAALDAARGAEVVFGDDSAAPPRIEYSEPQDIEVDGEPAVRYTVRGSDIHASVECSPTEATFDVVAIPGFATATVAVFMVQLDQSNEGSLDYSTVDTLISTLRKPDSTTGQPR
ncbi:hypothetical protein [Rhodococcoides navarretei]|uniref:DUF8017 domain-containing protein n=1 Tax=Rhodococcus navarretei TaxID=3128981 RepID=A0ABU9CSQ2_9NOCA